MTILICPDSFKGTLSAKEAAEAIEEGVKKTLPNCDTILFPIADGGEGTLEIITEALHGRFEEITVKDPLGRPVPARIGFAKIGDFEIVVIEAAQANGLTLLKENELNPFLTTTFGVGEMIRYSIDHLPENGEIFIGIGGSATNDGGIGMAQAFGWQFLDEQGNSLPFEERGLCAKSLEKLGKILPPKAPIKLPKITILSDVNNPLLGTTGASFVYAKQKGAKPDDIPKLEELLTQLRDIAKRDLGKEMNEIRGGGAAGGLGAGLVTFLGAEIKPGLEEIARLTGLEEKIKTAGLVITGEGKMDSQTSYDKGPYLIAKLAKKHGKKVIALCGHKEVTPPLFDAVYGTNELPEFDSNNITKNAKKLLCDLSQKAIAIV